MKDVETECWRNCRDHQDQQCLEDLIGNLGFHSTIIRVKFKAKTIVPSKLTNTNEVFSDVGDM